MAMLDPSLFNSSLTTHGFTGHEMVDPVGLIHMNGRVYDPEIGRFLTADPFVQDLSNTQALNRYSYVLNDPLSMTDPTGFFFGSVFNAIGNFIGKLFSAVASVFKAALKIPLIRAVVQIAACTGSGPVGVGVCVAAAGALTALAGGSLSDAIQAMAFSVAQMGSSLGTGIIVASGIFGHAAYLATVGLHGVVAGALSLIQGGSFMEGFASGAFSEAAQPFLGAFPKGSFQQMTISATIGGTASVLVGGKFANGAITAAFAYAARICAEGGCDEIVGAGGIPANDPEIYRENCNCDRMLPDSVTRAIDALRSGLIAAGDKEDLRLLSKWDIQYVDINEGSTYAATVYKTRVTDVYAGIQYLEQGEINFIVAHEFVHLTPRNYALYSGLSFGDRLAAELNNTAAWEIDANNRARIVLGISQIPG
jgi:RHS repeat-associated protein